MRGTRDNVQHTPGVRTLACHVWCRAARARVMNTYVRTQFFTLLQNCWLRSALFVFTKNGLVFCHFNDFNLTF